MNYLYSARFGLLRIKASHAEDECLTGILLWDHSAVWATVVLERKTAFLRGSGITEQLSGTESIDDLTIIPKH